MRTLCSINPFKLFFISETTLTEFVIGLFSIVIGLWLGLNRLPHTIYHHMPLMHVCGWLLLFSGLLKVVGTCTLRLHWRINSCMLATIVWLFVSYAFFQMREYFGVSTLGLGIPISVLLSLVNACLYTKLVLVDNDRKRHPHGQ